MSTPLKERNAALGDDVVYAVGEVLIDDEKTCITRWRFAPGAQTGWHRHEWDYVTIHGSGGRLQLENAAGDIMNIDYVEGSHRAFDAPVTHNAKNVSDVEVVALEIEYKR
jgi:quercetin dioxygenase-like cupin family protein